MRWRPGPHGSGGNPPLGSFPGLRSRTLTSLFAFFFFALSCMLPFICLLFMFGVGVRCGLPAFRSLGTTSHIGGPGGVFCLRPDRPGPHGPGGVPPLGSFAGLRSRTLISFFSFFFLVLSCMLHFIGLLFMFSLASAAANALENVLMVIADRLQHGFV